jgi:hypothetical protein
MTTEVFYQTKGVKEEMLRVETGKRIDHFYLPGSKLKMTVYDHTNSYTYPGSFVEINQIELDENAYEIIEAVLKGADKETLLTIFDRRTTNSAGFLPLGEHILPFIDSHPVLTEKYRIKRVSVTR